MKVFTPIIIRVIIILMLFGCLLDMPYAYYQLLRSMVCGSCIFFVFNEYENDRVYKIIPLIFLAILFNPIAPIQSFTQWKVVDITLACIFIIWVVVDIIFILKNSKNPVAKKDY